MREYDACECVGGVKKRKMENKDTLQMHAKHRHFPLDTIKSNPPRSLNIC